MNETVSIPKDEYERLKALKADVILSKEKLLEPVSDELALIIYKGRPIKHINKTQLELPVTWRAIWKLVKEKIKTTLKD